MAKIFHTNIDLKKNSLENARVKESPNHNHDIINKEFLDSQIKFDTVNKTKTSTKFPWVTGIENNNPKEIFDKLLFPVVYPEYKNPVFENIVIKNNKPNDTARLNKTISGVISFKLNNPDRSIISDARMNVLNTNQAIVHTFNVANLFDTKINFEFLLTSDIKYFELVQEFDSALPKTDSNNQVHINPDFSTPYTLKHKIEISEFIDKFNLIDNILYKLITNINNQQEFENLLSGNFVKQSLPEYLQDGFNMLGDDFPLVKNKNNILALVINKEYINRNLLIDIEDIGRDSTFSQAVNIVISDLVLIDSSKQIISFFDNNKEYCLLLYELGFPSKDVKIKINFK